MKKIYIDHETAIEILIGSILMVTVFGIMGTGIFLLRNEDTPQKAAVVEAPVLADEPPPEVGPKKEVPAPSLTAQAALVYDISKGETIYGKNADRTVPLASVTKLAVAFIASQILEDTDIITVSPQAAFTDYGFSAGEQFSVKDARRYGLVTSSNVLLTALAEAAGEKLDPTSSSPLLTFLTHAETVLRNDYGLTTITLNNASGLDVGNGRAGGYASAHDIASLLMIINEEAPEIHRDSSYPFTILTSRAGVRREGENTNEIIHTLPGLIGSKTGFTDLAGGNLAVIVNVGLARPVAVVVLGSTKSERFSDVNALVKFVIESQQ